jgi:hypothetical protein
MSGTSKAGTSKAGTASKAAMSVEDEAREANLSFWEVATQHEAAEAHEGAAAAAGHYGDDEQEGDEDYQMDEAEEEEEEDATTTDGGGRTTDGGGTTTDGGGTTTDGGSVKKPRKPRKDRKPQKLADTTDEITLISESGLPLEPADVAAGYGHQLGCIVRESMSINTKHLRSEANARLLDNCVKKLHRRYKFPAPYTDNLDLSNKVNKLAITKMSNALSSWKTRVKNKITKNESWEDIKKGEPMLDEDEFKIFKAEMETDEAKAWTEWGRSMREQNIGNQRCGSGGYRGKKAIWAAEDAEVARLGKVNPWLKITDEQTRYFVRARYYLDKVTKEFVTDDDEVRLFEKKLVRNLPTVHLLSY